jgi:2-keto-4-pentenoate hydratase
MQAQLAALREARAKGMPRRGWKVGINVPEVLERLGLRHSGVAWLDGWQVRRSGEALAAPPGSRLHVEPELCLALAAAPDRAAGREAARACLAQVAPALEIVDYARPASGLDEVVAHGMFHAGCVLGPAQPPGAARELGSRWPVLKLQGSPALRPRPDLVPEHLGDLVLFVAAFLEAFGERLEAGDLILSGSYTELALPVAEGQTVRGDFGPLGEVELRIGAEGQAAPGRW